MKSQLKKFLQNLFSRKSSYDIRCIAIADVRFRLASQKFINIPNRKAKL